MPVWWTNRSLPLSSGVMKPKPLSSLNHFTVPVAISFPPACVNCGRGRRLAATTAGAEHCLCRAGCPALTPPTLPGAARRGSLGSVPRMRLEELDRVAGGIVDEDLIAADTLDDLTAKAGPGRPQTLDVAGEIGHLERDPVPPARLRPAPVGERLAATALATRCAEQQAQVAAPQHRERRRGMHLDIEAEEVAIEADRRVDVVHDVAHADCSHHRIVAHAAVRGRHGRRIS